LKTPLFYLELVLTVYPILLTYATTDDYIERQRRKAEQLISSQGEGKAEQEAKS